MKSALASVVFLVVMLLVILLGAGEDAGSLLWIAVLYTGALSVAFALVAVGGAFTSEQLGGGRRLMTVLIALAVLGGFVLALVAIVNAFDAALG